MLEMVAAYWLYYPNTHLKFVRKRRNTLVIMAVVSSENLTGHLVNISLQRTWHCSSGRTQARNTAGKLPKAEESNGRSFTAPSRGNADWLVAYLNANYASPH